MCVCVCVCVAIREQASDWKEPGAVEMPRGQPREGIFYQSPHTLYTQIHTPTHTQCEQTDNDVETRLAFFMYFH